VNIAVFQGLVSVHEMSALVVTAGDRGNHLRSASVGRSFICSVAVHGEYAVERPNQKAAVTGGHELERVRSDRAGKAVIGCGPGKPGNPAGCAGREAERCDAPDTSMDIHRPPNQPAGLSRKLSAGASDANGRVAAHL
jgi:hypothetical protein